MLGMLLLLAHSGRVAATPSLSPDVVAAASSTTSCEDHDIRCRAGRGPILDSALGLTEALWVGPESRGIYIGSPSIWKTDAGPVMASHDFFGQSTLGTTTQVLVDRSGAATGAEARWEHAGNVSNMYWGNIFAHPKRPAELYLLGVSGPAGNRVQTGIHAGRDIVISRSLDDTGATWTPAVTLFAASPGNTSYHCAPTPALVASDGRLYRAFEAAIAGGTHGIRALIISTAAPVSASTDLLDPTSWIQSTMVDPGATEDASLHALGWDNRTHWTWEEGNAVEGPSGEIFNLIRIDGQTNQSNTQNKAAVLRLDRSGTKLSFVQMINFPTCSSKFVVRRDPVSKLYFTLSTDATAVAIAQDTVFARNHLILAVSADLFRWDTCTVVLMDDTGFSSVDSARYTGFHYVDWVFEGVDILMAIRTGYRGANSFHNANRLTTLRVVNYSRHVLPVASSNDSQCAHDWRSEYQLVGTGWCRPTANFSEAGVGRSAIDCAQICSGTSGCHSFAIEREAPGRTGGHNFGGCVLYPGAATASGGTDSGGVRCFTKALGAPQDPLLPLKADDADVPDGFDCNLRRAAHAHAQRIITDRVQLAAVRDGLRMDFFCGASSLDPAPAGPVFAHPYEDPSASAMQLWVAPPCAQSRNFEVRASSPCGSDRTGDGSQDKPYASPARARDALRTHKDRAGNATVWISAGIYFLNQTLELGPLDSNVTWARHGDGEAVLSGGCPIPNSSSGKWAPSASNKGAFTATVGTAWGEDGISALFVDGKRYWRARWPNANPDDGPIFPPHGPPGTGGKTKLPNGGGWSSLVPRGWAPAFGSVRPAAGGAPVTQIRWENVTRNFTSTGTRNGSYHWTEGGAANERFVRPLKLSFHKQTPDNISLYICCLFFWSSLPAVWMSAMLPGTARQFLGLDGACGACREPQPSRALASGCRRDGDHRRCGPHV
jgi:hypothetical protein